MKNPRIIFTVTLLAYLFHLPSLTCAAELQGKLEKFGPLGILPAPFVTVTLNARDTSKIIKTVHTDSYGIYRFNECQPGIYYLKVWGKGTYDKPLNFEVRVLDKPVTNIAPILIHSLKFKYPKDGQTITGKTDIIIRGTHYNIPEDAFVWIVLKHKNGNYYLTTKYPIIIKPDETWYSKPIYIVEGIIEILAVLVNKECNSKLRSISSSLLSFRFTELPDHYKILEHRKINVHRL